MKQLTHKYNDDHTAIKVEITKGSAKPYTLGRSTKFVALHPQILWEMLKLRKDAGWTFQRIAEKYGVTATRVSNNLAKFSVPLLLNDMGELEEEISKLKSDLTKCRTRTNRYANQIKKLGGTPER